MLWRSVRRGALRLEGPASHRGGAILLSDRKSDRRSAGGHHGQRAKTQQSRNPKTEEETGARGCCRWIDQGPIGTDGQSEEERLRREDMTVRTSETTVTFLRSFALSAIDHPQAQGTYRLVIDEEEILGISFIAYRRLATMLDTPATAVRTGPHQVFVIDSAELAGALEADARPRGSPS
jgi:hypothetical protein